MRACSFVVIVREGQFPVRHLKLASGLHWVCARQQSMSLRGFCLPCMRNVQRSLILPSVKSLQATTTDIVALVLTDSHIDDVTRVVLTDTHTMSCFVFTDTMSHVLCSQTHTMSHVLCLQTHTMSHVLCSQTHTHKMSHVLCSQTHTKTLPHLCSKHTQKLSHFAHGSSRRHFFKLCRQMYTHTLSDLRGQTDTVTVVLTDALTASHLCSQTHTQIASHLCSQTHTQIASHLCSQTHTITVTPVLTATHVHRHTCDH